MIALETAITDYFKQFTEHVFLNARTPADPNEELFPRITFQYASTDFFGRTLYEFNIWSLDTLKALTIAESIENDIPVLGGTSLKIKGGIVHEYFNYYTGKWTEFNLKDASYLFAQHIKEFPDKEFKTRESNGKTRGSIEFFRGNPFLLPLEDPDTRITRYRGLIEALSHLI